MFFFQAEDGIRGLVRSRGLGDVYKRQGLANGVRIGGAHGQRRDGRIQAAVDPGQDGPGFALSLIHI